jgi:hypothetical protein
MAARRALRSFPPDILTKNIVVCELCICSAYLSTLTIGPPLERLSNKELKPHVTEINLHYVVYFVLGMTDEIGRQRGRRESKATTLHVERL